MEFRHGVQPLGCSRSFTYPLSRLKPELRTCPRSFTYPLSRLKPELRTSAQIVNRQSDSAAGQERCRLHKRLESFVFADRIEVPFLVDRLDVRETGGERLFETLDRGFDVSHGGKEARHEIALVRRRGAGSGGHQAYPFGLAQNGGVDGQSLQTLFSALRKALLLEVERAQVYVERGHISVQTDGLLEASFRFLFVVYGKVNGPQVVVGVGVLGIDPYG